MPVYEYSALNARGKSITGIVDAEGAAAARQKIRSEGNFPIELNEVSDTRSVREDSPTGILFQLFARISQAEITMMTRQLATLIGAGFPLVSALDTLVPQIRSKALKKTMAHLKSMVVEGSSFFDALGKFPHIFSDIYINMVGAGESSGTLEIVLERLADITEKQEALKNRMITAMIYPLLIMAISTLIVTFLLIYVTPKIMSMFESLKQALPLPTQILIATSNIFTAYWWALVLAVIALLMGLRQVRKSTAGRRFLDRFLLRLPLFGSLIGKLAAARFARTLGSLLDNGVSMLPALTIVENIVGNVTIAEAVTHTRENVVKGQSLGKSLDVKGVFPTMAIQMIMVGEQSGNLEEMLNKVADVFEKDVETSVMRLTALVEPVMMLIMAAVVLFIVLAICLPIFEMNQFIR